MRIPIRAISPVFKLPGTTTTSTTAGAVKPSQNQKEKHMITAEIPKEVTFELPEGRFKATLTRLKPFTKQAGSGPQEWIRILFEVRVPGLSERFETVAGRSFKFDLKPGSELRNFLTGLLGKEFFKEHSGQQVSLDPLVGMQCEIELEHFYGEGYSKPLIMVAKVCPQVKEIKFGKN